MENTAAYSKYSDDEIVVLNHFFTNCTSPVYAARDVMPSELWANLAGGASRSHLDLRDRFLKIFRETTETEQAYSDLMTTMACNIKASSTDALRPAMMKAKAFMSKYAVEYGHNSLKDSCVDRIVVDRVSIRVAKLLEDSSLMAAQEKSTRYVKFDELKPVLPFTSVSASTAQRAESLLERSTIIYNRMTQACFHHYMTTLDPKDFRTSDAMARTATAKAFDTARYCLLVNKPTALAFTIPSRETERHIARLLAHHNAEVRGLARMIRDEAQQINPSLITHVTENKFFGEEVPMTDILDAVARPGQVMNIGRAWNDEPRVDLVSGDMNLFGLATSVYMANNQSPTAAFGYDDVYEAITTKDNGEELALQIIERRLAKRGQHDELPKEFGCGEYIFDIIIDYGAYRDLQRHRVGTQIVSDLNCVNGYTTPELLRDPKFRDLCEEYDAYMEEVGEVHALYREVDPSAAEYWFTLAHNVRFTYTCNFKQVIYLCELRTKPTGHVCYRKVACEMYDLLRDGLLGADSPRQARFDALFRIDRSTDTDRRSQENAAQAKKTVF